MKRKIIICFWKKRDSSFHKRFIVNEVENNEVNE